MDNARRPSRDEKLSLTCLFSSEDDDEEVVEEEEEEEEGDRLWKM